MAEYPKLPGVPDLAIAGKHRFEIRTNTHTLENGLYDDEGRRLGGVVEIKCAIHVQILLATGQTINVASSNVDGQMASQHRLYLNDEQRDALKGYLRGEYNENDPAV